MAFGVNLARTAVRGFVPKATAAARRFSSNSEGPLRKSESESQQLQSENRRPLERVVSNLTLGAVGAANLYALATGLESMSKGEFKWFGDNTGPWC